MSRSLLTLVLILGLAALSHAQEPQHGVREFTKSDTWVVPAGVTHIVVELWGGGGGGGGGGAAVILAGNIVSGSAGGGGGSGAYVRASLGVTEGQTYQISLGAGGAGGQAANGREPAQRGANGGDTVFALDHQPLVLAHGGGGGAPADSKLRGGQGGVGGAGQEGSNILVRHGIAGAAGREGGWESHPTPGGAGGIAVLGTTQPLGSSGGAGGNASYAERSTKGEAGGGGAVILTW